MKIEKFKIPYVDREISFDIPHGFVFLKGNNGAGKTMFLDALSGLSVRNCSSIIERPKNIYINQNAFFSDKLKTIYLLKFVYCLDGNIWNEKKFWLFLENNLENEEIASIMNIMKKKWGILSGGERRFVYLLIMLSLSRECYIIDEPFVFLDNTKKQVIIKIIKSRLSENRDIILSSHEYIDEINKMKPYIVEL